jgi:hypothetical protein
MLRVTTCRIALKTGLTVFIKSQNLPQRLRKGTRTLSHICCRHLRRCKVASALEKQLQDAAWQAAGASR